MENEKNFRQPETKSNPFEKSINFVKENASKFLTVIISVMYIVQGAYQLVKRDTDWLDFVGNLLTSIIIGVLIYSNLRASGLADGRKAPEFVASVNLYTSKKDEISKTKQYKLPAYCSYKNETTLQETKRDFLLDSGIQYSLWMNGAYDDKESKLYKSLDEEQIYALEHVNKVKAPKITTRYLMSDSPKLTKKKYLKANRHERDEKDYVLDGAIMDFISIIIFAFAFSFYVLKPIVDGDTIASILWNAFQVLIWLFNGIVKYYQSKDFMKNEYRQTHYVVKIEYLSEFISILRDDEHMLDNYDYTLLAEKEINTNVEEIKENKNGSQELL